MLVSPEVLVHVSVTHELAVSCMSMKAYRSSVETVNVNQRFVWHLTLCCYLLQASFKQTDTETVSCK